MAQRELQAPEDLLFLNTTDLADAFDTLNQLTTREFQHKTRRQSCTYKLSRCSHDTDGKDQEDRTCPRVGARLLLEQVVFFVLELFRCIGMEGKCIVLPWGIVQVYPGCNITERGGCCQRTTLAEDRHERTTYTTSRMIPIPRLMCNISVLCASVTRVEDTSAPPSAVTELAPRSRAAKNAVGSKVARTLDFISRLPARR